MIKRYLVSFVLIFSIVFSCCACANAQGDYRGVLRVGLSYGGSAKSTASFSSGSDIEVYDINNMALIGTIPGGAAATIVNSGGALSSDGIFQSSGGVRLDSVGIISYGGVPYRGSFELLPRDGNITVINMVNTEEYLASLLGKEMSASWPIEALKAQAVCARNYAVTIAGKHSSYGFDICSTVDCQVYGGMNSEADSTRRAVKETAGVVVKYNGRVVPLYYFSCDGGYTENSENVWVSAEGYLRGKQDIYEDPASAKLYNWTTTMTKSEIEEALSKKNINIGELVDIVINEVSENNGVISMTFVGTKDSKTVTKTQTRTTLSLNSQAYTIEKLAGKIVKTEKVTLSDIVPKARFVLTKDGVEEAVRDIYRLTENGLERIELDVSPKVEEEEGEEAMFETYIFKGHGWGHLVGMSQWGAYSMAKNGMDYTDILNFYFTDIEISVN